MERDDSLESKIGFGREMFSDLLSAGALLVPVSGDRNVARIFDSLEELGVGSRTRIALVSGFLGLKYAAYALGSYVAYLEIVGR